MRNAAKTVTSRPWGFPFFGRELYFDNTACDTFSPHRLSDAGGEEDDVVVVNDEEWNWEREAILPTPADRGSEWII